MSETSNTTQTEPELKKYYSQFSAEEIEAHLGAAKKLNSGIDLGSDNKLDKSDIGLTNVENLSSTQILAKLTSKNVTDALGYTPPKSDTTYSEATTTSTGLLSKDDKVKLNSIESGANKTVVDTTLNESSTNPVQNSVITKALNLRMNIYQEIFILNLN